VNGTAIEFWIADFGDLWRQNYYYQYSNIRNKIEKMLEIKKTPIPVDVLIIISSLLTNKLKALYKGKRVFIIINGFDSKEFVLKGIYTGKLFEYLATGNGFSNWRIERSCSSVEGDRSENSY
jgi:hypothetical protein